VKHRQKRLVSLNKRMAFIHFLKMLTCKIWKRYKYLANTSPNFHTICRMYVTYKQYPTFFVDEWNRNPNLAVWQLNVEVVVLQGCRKFKYLFFFFFFWALFVVLHVIVEWFRWGSFDDGIGSMLFNWKKLWGVWVTALGDNWCWSFKGMEGGGQEAIIWSWLKKRRRGNFFWKGKS
jgi:hypothetical protein